jgi:hypothetical protein
MGFLGISGKRWKQVGKIALKAAPLVAAPFTGGASLLALGAGAGALSGALDGGGWKGALLGGGLGAIPVPGAGGAVASGATKVGLKEVAKGVAKGAATNFATGTGTSLATGQGLKNSLQAGGSGALSGIGTTGGAGGVKQAAQQIGKNVALNVGSQYASKGLQQAGVPGGLAAQGGNVFSNYLGKQFNGRAPSGNNFASSGQRVVAPQGQASAPGVDWRSLLTGAVQGGLAASQQGGSAQPTYPGGSPSTGLGWGRGGAAPTGGQTGGQQQQQQPPGDQPPGFWEKYGPLIAQGGGVVGGMLAGQQATKMAQKRSPEELAALGGAQGAAGQMGQLGGSLARQGQNYLADPAAYYQTLLGGNRAAMAQAVAGPTAQLTGVYRGAERNLNQQGIRGAARDLAATDLNRDRASKIAGLTTGVQPYAAEQLASLGNNALGQGTAMLGNAGNVYGNLLTQGAANRTYARKEGGETGAAIGGLARDVGEVAFKKGAKPTTGTTQDNGRVQGPPSPAPAPTAPQGGTLQPPPAPTPGAGQLPFSTPGNLGVDFRTGVRKPAASYRPPVDFGLGQY